MVRNSSVPARNSFLRPSRFRALWVLAGLALAAPAGAQLTDSQLWATDGPVNAMALSGNTLFISGQDRMA